MKFERMFMQLLPYTHSREDDGKVVLVVIDHCLSLGADLQLHQTSLSADLSCDLESRGERERRRVIKYYTTEAYIVVWQTGS